MTLRRLFAINLPLALLFGLSCALLPAEICAVYGLTANTLGLDAVTRQMLRDIGARNM